MEKTDDKKATCAALKQLAKALKRFKEQTLSSSVPQTGRFPRHAPAPAWSAMSAARAPGADDGRRDEGY